MRFHLGPWIIDVLCAVILVSMGMLGGIALEAKKQKATYAYGFNEKSALWNRIRVDEKGRIILSPETIRDIADAMKVPE